MVIINETIRNVLNRIFLVGISCNGDIPTIYSQAIAALENLNNSIVNINATSVNNAPFAWKRDKLLILRVDNLMFAYRRKILQNGDTIIIVEEVSQNGIIVTESATKSILSLMERMENLYKK